MNYCYVHLFKTKGVLLSEAIEEIESVLEESHKTSLQAFKVTSEFGLIYSFSL